MDKKIAAMLMLAVTGMVYFSSASAMRCGNSLVNEGDTVAQLVNACGVPTATTNSNLVYVNLEGSGMNYYIHVDESGQIENITFSRN